MKQFVLVAVIGILSVFLLTGTTLAVCGDGNLELGEECDDGDTNDYNACRNDCTIYVPYFPDVPGYPTPHWAFEYVQQLYEYAISQGYPDGTYKPGNNVSRAEMSAYVIRTIDLVGDVTSVVPGTGLTGGGDSGDVTLDVDSTYVQRRVSSTCTTGSSIRAIAENGGIICETDDGIVTETDPTVLASVKDGISWAEISGRPSGLDDGDDVGITSETDPQVGTLTSGKWCKTNGSQVNCTSNAPSTACAGNDANDIMVKVGPVCVDKYEASVWSGPSGGTQYGASSDNYSCSDNGNDCSSTNPIYARSEAGVTPSRYITWFQAQQACAMSGKRLLTNAEWQMAAAGTPDPGTDNGSSDCAISSSLSLTGSRSNCVSNWEVNDMVGNLWEWVADWMQGNTNPWAPSTGTTNADYGGDMLQGTNPAQFQGSGQNFPSALTRGGNWNYDTFAGVFALNANLGPSYSFINLGFRCAR